jgi:hypothetical protein
MQVLILKPSGRVSIAGQRLKNSSVRSTGGYQRIYFGPSQGAEMTELKMSQQPLNLTVQIRLCLTKCDRERVDYLSRLADKITFAF